jgi:hypothetical protein
MALRFATRGTGASVCPGGACTHGLPYTPDEVIVIPFSAAGSVGVCSVLTSFADTINVYVTCGGAASNCSIIAACNHSWMK